MTPLRLILQGARHYWRTHLGVVLGAALATMVLTGSLLVGDSVKATLRRQALDRVGRADVAMTGGERFFRAALADTAGAEAAPVLMLRGSVVRPDGASRVNQVQVLGVDQRFWKLSPSGAAVDLPDDGVTLNARLAQQLGVAAGDTVIVRVEKPGMFSKDAPLSGEENEVVAMRVKVARVVGDADYGRFALTASQVPPFTVFAPLGRVQEQASLAGKSNLLLTSTGVAEEEVARAEIRQEQFKRKLTLRSIRGTAEPLIKIELRYLDERLFFASAKTGLSANWSLEDASLSLLDLPDNAGLELRTPRVFLDPPVVAAAPRGKDDRRVDSLTYFVNAIEAKSATPDPRPQTRNATPYSMVTAVEAPSSGFLPAELADDEIVISQWEADDLGIGTGAKVTLKYFTMGERRQLEEKTREFTVLAVLPMNEPQLNTSWMPDFPGLSDKQNCRDWKPGFDFDATRMRDKDQAYWEQYRGTPKAFVNLNVGQEMWGNRWGNVTALRWPAGTDRAEIEKALREKLTPEMLGFQFIPLREQALAAIEAPVDFGQLFVSFSFILIAAAAVLTGLLFVFSLEQRNAEAGLLLALGLRPGRVRRLFLAEGAVLALVGGLLGAMGAVLYTKVVLRALATVWRGAVGGVEFEFGAGPATLPTGVVSGVVVALLAMWLASRRQLRHSARELLTGELSSEPEASGPRRSGTGFQPVAAGSGTALPACRDGLPALDSHHGLEAPDDRLEPCPTPPRRVARVPAVVAVVALLLAMAIPFLATGPGAFFGAGSLLLIAGLALALRWLRGLAGATGGLESVTQLGTRNAARRRGRSVATIAVLASGVFMVVAVDSFRKTPPREGDPGDPGTGGFALVAESALPIYEDLGSAKGREAYGLDEKVMDGVRVVPMRLRDGDDASCLNLNKAMQPRLLGVKPEELAGRFRFSKKETGWAALGERSTLNAQRSTLNEAADDAVPGIVDANTLQWALKKKLGDTLEYRDDRGAPFKVRLVGTVAGSILQGSVVIDEAAFITRFPNSGGYRSFLIDCPPEKVAAVREHLSRQLADRGLEVVPTAQRLAEFNAVENTYLSIFQALGGLGLLLGSAGLAIVVARNVLERRREFGLLAAVGFRPRQLRRLVFAEHRWLIVAALVIGTVSALVAVWPQLAQKAGGFPIREIGVLLAALAGGCLFWTWLATRLALRGSGVAALRAE